MAVQTDYKFSKGVIEAINTSLNSSCISMQGDKWIIDPIFTELSQKLAKVLERDFTSLTPQKTVKLLARLNGLDSRISAFHPTPARIPHLSEIQFLTKDLAFQIKESNHFLAISRELDWLLEIFKSSEYNKFLHTLNALNSLFNFLHTYPITTPQRLHLVVQLEEVKQKIEEFSKVTESTVHALLSSILLDLKDPDARFTYSFPPPVFQKVLGEVKDRWAKNSDFSSLEVKKALERLKMVLSSTILSANGERQLKEGLDLLWVRFQEIGSNPDWEKNSTTLLFYSIYVHYVLKSDPFRVY
ncbi:MAG: hypothetical protein WC222_12075 [Parachlamydiales bacterium]|jgi:hypothetical protein